MSDVNYKETIQLPDTNFDQRANLTEKEPRIQEKWEEEELYRKMMEENEGKEKYILHDGPPYANGDVHIGTALNKILKDVVVRFRHLQGYQAPFVPGWDCHGLPIEWKVMQEIREKEENPTSAEIREQCADYANRWLDVQREQFKQLGCTGAWQEPYSTMDASYEESVIRVFGDLYRKGHVYRRRKTIHWCTECETALAAAELEYDEKTSPAVFVKFALNEGYAERFGATTDGTPGYVLIWTTTPWTLPANMATAVHPDLAYSLIRVHDPREKAPVDLIVADELVERLSTVLHLNAPEIRGTVEGKELEGLTYEHPFLDRTGEFVLADYVDLEEGTGCVHTAPGHGEEDYETGLKYDIDPVCPVNEKGMFTDEAGPYSGQFVHDANQHIASDLQEDGYLLDVRDIQHDYPHCWRCENPVIFRATRQWFVEVDHNNLRDRARDAIHSVDWVPDWGETRMEAMLDERPDWCISRQRNWGIPIPVVYCEQCEEPYLNEDLIERTAEIFGREGASSWFAQPVGTFLPDGASCAQCGGESFQQETDIFDVWFESGSSHHAVVQSHPDLSFPADLYLEGTDQHRGWFQLSLLPSVARTGQSPFRECVTHGFVVNEEGKKISKSDMEGLEMTAEVLSEEYGSDILRLWVTSVDFTDDIPISRDILDEKTEPYLKIRRTLRFLHGNLHDYEPEEHSVAFHELTELDLWILHRLRELIQEVTRHYEHYQFHRVIRAIRNFCTIEMSHFFLDVSKDRFYCDPEDSVERRSGQTVATRVISTITRLMAPILVHTAEELWDYIPGAEAESVHLSEWPQPPERWENEELAWRWGRLLEVRDAVYSEIENMREENVINESAETEVHLFTGNRDLSNLLASLANRLPGLFLVSEVHLHDGPVPDDVHVPEELPGLGFRVEKTENEKCDRCWTYRESVGIDPEFDDLCKRCLDIVQDHVANG